MPIATVDKNTEITLIETQLKKLGITMPELPEFEPLPKTSVTEQDLIAALRASKADDPNQDPAVQRVYTALQLANYGTLGYVEQSRAERAKYDALLGHRDRLHKKVIEVFNTAAATIAEHGPTVAHLRDLGQVAVNRDTPEVVTAAVTVNTALRTGETAKTAAWILLGLGRPQIIGAGPSYLAWCAPTVEEADKIEASGPHTLWNTARAGVALSLPLTPREVSERWTSLRTAQEERRAQRERDRPRQRGAVIVSAANL